MRVRLGRDGEDNPAVLADLHPCRGRRDRRPRARPDRRVGQDLDRGARLSRLPLRPAAPARRCDGHRLGRAGRRRARGRDRATSTPATRGHWRTSSSDGCAGSRRSSAEGLEEGLPMADDLDGDRASLSSSRAAGHADGPARPPVARGRRRGSPPGDRPVPVVASRRRRPVLPGPGARPACGGKCAGESP